MSRLLLVFSLACTPVPDVGDCLDADKVTGYADLDGDGFGRAALGDVCPGPRVATSDQDCNDTLPEAFPGAPELCDGVDNDCDGDIDEGFASTQYFGDDDGDGFGDADRTFESCQDPGGTWASEPGDCDDDDPKINPGRDEICDSGDDDDCDTFIDCADPDCEASSACLLPCADEALPGPLPLTLTGSTTGRGDDFTDADCGFGAASADLAFQFQAPDDGVYVFDTFGSDFDTVLHAYAGCGGGLLECNDDVVAGVYSSEVWLELLAGETVVVVVDGFGDQEDGSFVLNGRRQ